MKFEVVNDKGVTVMQTFENPCIPSEEVLEIMSKAGYKFKIEGKLVSLKKLKEIERSNTVD